MTDAPQLWLPFASSTPSSASSAPTSLLSSAPAMWPFATPRKTTTRATSATIARHAPVRSSHGSAGTAARSRRGVKHTAAASPSTTRWRDTDQQSMAAMLAVPRPQRRSECLQEARPCPWVGCSRHLLLRVTESQGQDRRPTTLALNTPPRGQTEMGRRRGLPASSAAAVVRAWIDEAVEQLALMEWTCELDVLDAYPGGLPNNVLARLLGVTDKDIKQVLTKHKPRLKRRLREWDPTPDNDEAPPCDNAWLDSMMTI